VSTKVAFSIMSKVAYVAASF